MIRCLDATDNRKFTGLSPIQLLTHAKRLTLYITGISSCYPSVQVGDWHSLNVSQVHYLDLSAIGHFADPQASDRLLGIGKVYNAYKNN